MAARFLAALMARPRVKRLLSSDHFSVDGTMIQAWSSLGYFHIDIAEVRIAQGKLYLFVAIDRTSKFAFVQLHEKATRRVAGDFLRALIAAVPYKVHTVLTDNGIAFADLPKNRNGPTATWSGGHIFGRTCADNGITHKLTKPYHPWTNGQAERINRTIKDATLKVFHDPDIESLKAPVLAFVKTDNFAKHLKALRWKTPFEAIACEWTQDPTIFKINPRHLILGPNRLPLASRGDGSIRQRR